MMESVHNLKSTVLTIGHNAFMVQYAPILSNITLCAVITVQSQTHLLLYEHILEVFKVSFVANNYQKDVKFGN